MDSHWLLGVLLTLLCGTPQVVTEPDLARSAGVTHILWTFQLCTGPRLLGTGHTVDHTCSVTGNTPLDGVGLPSGVTGMCGGVTGVRAHAAVSSLTTLVETLPGLSPGLPDVAYICFVPFY